MLLSSKSGKYLFIKLTIVSLNFSFIISYLLGLVMSATPKSTLSISSNLILSSISSVLELMLDIFMRSPLGHLYGSVPYVRKTYWDLRVNDLIKKHRVGSIASVDYPIHRAYLQKFQPKWAPVLTTYLNSYFLLQT